MCIRDSVTGGPIYYIRAAFKGRFGAFLAGFFSVAIILALGFMGNMVQSNSIGAAFSNAFHIPALVVGFFVAAVSAFIFIGGVKRIASVTEKLVPVMAVFYIVGCLIILFINRSTLLNCFQQIFVLAFQPQAMAGGVAGVTVKTAMRFGVARGLFSNEAGMGSTPHAHALAKVCLLYTSDPVQNHCIVPFFIHPGRTRSKRPPFPTQPAHPVLHSGSQSRCPV